MHRLTSVLGMPQHRFGSIHVVGTNGKSSVAQMTAALLEAHGTSAGACLSPHLVRWAERVRIRGREIDGGAFGAAVERTAQAAEAVNRALEDEGDAVTQFEAATAAAFVSLAGARVSAGVIEAGLGGRLDATNVIPSRVTVLTSVGLDHTEWLGETEVEIAGEKLAVLRDATTLVTGEVSAEVDALAARTAEQRGATHVRAPLDPGDVELRAPGPFQRRNFALAIAAAEAYLGTIDRAEARRVAAALTIPGRLEVVSADPPTILDVAHNPDGAAALAQALPEVSAGRPVFACIAILADKDAEAMLAALEPALEQVVCTELPEARLLASARPGARSWPAVELAAISERLGLDAECVEEPGAAMMRARELAAVRKGVALAAGSHYLLGAAWTRRHAQSFSR
jgi:dihydrofolate synthase/folylpolyglutamate synthase